MSKPLGMANRFASIYGLSLCTTALHASVVPVAVTGGPAADTGGAHLYEFVSVDAFIDSTGAVTFGGRLNDAARSSAIWHGRSDAPRLVVRAGDTAPGLAGYTIQLPSLKSAGSADGGLFTFTSGLAGPGITAENRLVIWQWNGGTVRRVARQGDPAIGTDSSYSLLFPAPAGARGDAGFLATLRSGSSTPATATGVWSGPPEDLRLRARLGDIPERADGSALISLSIPYVDSYGRAWSMTQLEGPTVRREALILSDTAGSRVVARAGWPSADLPADTNMSGVRTPVFERQGGVVFATDLRPPDWPHRSGFGVWQSDGHGEPTLLFREGVPVPGGAPEDRLAFEAILDVDAAGRLLMKAVRITASGERYDLWVWDNGQFTPVALGGEMFPGTSLVFENFGPAYFNESGEVAYYAHFMDVGGDEPVEDQGVVIRDASLISHIVYRGTDGFPLPDGSMMPAGFKLNGFGDLGEGLLSARFSDGRVGHYLATVPEPGSMATVVCAAYALTRTRCSGPRRPSPSRRS